MYSKKEKMKRTILTLIFLFALTACSARRTQEVTYQPVAATQQAGMPNPASLHCTQQGNKLEIHTAADGSQNGVCVFPDGSSCDEWAYFRGECAPKQKSPTPSIPVEETSQAGENGVGENASGGYMAPGTAEAIADWWGVIKRTDKGAQYDDYFERLDLGQPIDFGIDGADSALKAQIESLRDTDKVVHLYGKLLSNVPDYNGSQIIVERIEVGA
jgi:putative hemolysin